MSLHTQAAHSQEKRCTAAVHPHCVAGRVGIVVQIGAQRATRTLSYTLSYSASCAARVAFSCSCSDRSLFTRAARIFSASLKGQEQQHYLLMLTAGTCLANPIYCSYAAHMRLICDGQRLAASCSAAVNASSACVARLATPHQVVYGGSTVRNTAACKSLQLVNSAATYSRSSTLSSRKRCTSLLLASCICICLLSADDSASASAAATAASSRCRSACSRVCIVACMKQPLLTCLSMCRLRATCDELQACGVSMSHAACA